MKRMRACDLFGGREVIIQRMTSRIQEWLRKISVADWVMLEDELNLPQGTFEGILLKDQPVDPQIYFKIKEISGISISECLGKPNFDKVQLEEWEKQSTGRPMMLVAALSLGTSDVKKRADVIDLQLYVMLRSIVELNWSNESQED